MAPSSGRGDHRGGLPDKVRPGINGWLVEPGRPDALAAAISGALSRLPYLAAMGEEGRRIVETEFARKPIVARQHLEMPVSSWRNRCLQPLVAGADQPRRTAAAFAVGTFLQFLAVSRAADRDRIHGGVPAAAQSPGDVHRPLHQPAVDHGAVVLPTLAGGWILGLPLPTDVGSRFSALMNLGSTSAEFWRRAGELVAPFAWAFIVGSTMAAALVAALAYVVAARFLTRIRPSQMSA